jgi:molybdopterin-guanine dinucleotide biosynthesis protein A
MPWLSSELIRLQADDYLKKPAEILAARAGELSEPLHSIYRKSIHTKLVRYLEEGNSPAVIDFYHLADTRFFELPLTAETRRALTNINRPRDLRSLF